MNLLPIVIQMRTKPIFDLLIQSGIDVNTVDIEGEAPIHYALGEKSRRKFIRPLVEAGADINLEDGKDLVPIFAALGNTEYKPDQTIELAEELIALGADITHVGKRGTNALWIGNQREQTIVDFVKAKGVAEYRVPDGYYDDLTGYDKLVKSIHANDFGTFEHSFGAAELQREKQILLLRFAIDRGRLRFVKQMVESGVPAYLRNRDGVFPYQLAQSCREKEIAAYLKSQMKGYHSEVKKRVARVRPLYDRLIAALE